ncbi:hypothetical protein QBC36DRAFT_353904 [Triangularia setosa]|uniref:DUF6603 domain-containing protein n=1 Tax=Triangularia setosa TaxID=2587417 RepID=A0AAN6WEZ6_9PEZI|nr:hypothetical protein QBC36DRAFT_353904 [Podospora setosa]
MAGTDYYRVDSFHINVDAGDSAIHILSEPDPKGGKRKVRKAIFIDGGKSEESTWRATISDTIQDIETKFECQGPEKLGKGNTERKMLKFDAFVVTHWDADHYEGIMDYLSNNLAEMTFKNKKKEDIKLWKLQRAFYLPGGNPLSVFFAPDTSGITSKNRESFEIVDGGNSTKNLTIYRGKKQKDAEHALMLRATTEDLLGRNFFDSREIGWQLGDKEPKDIDSIKELLKINGPRLLPKPSNDYPIPGMYCVAVNKEVLGHQFKIEITETNASSICAMVIWPSERVSHYFAGDAHARLESAITDWAKCKVTSMKLSHHGASTSTPLPYMFDTFLPKNILASAGGGSYGHPRWELMFAMHSWLKKRSDAGRYGTPLFLTQYPSYMVKDANGKFQTKSRFSTSMLDKSSDPILKAISDWELGINNVRAGNSKPSLDRIHEKYKKWTAGLKVKLTPALRKQWVLERIESFMKLLTVTPSTATAAASNGVGQGQTRMVDTRKLITYVCLISRPVLLEGDGEAYMLMYDGTVQRYGQHNFTTSTRGPYNLRSRARQNNVLNDALIWWVADEEEDAIDTFPDPSVDTPEIRDMTLHGHAASNGSFDDTKHRRVGSWDIVQDDTWDSDDDDDEDFYGMTSLTSQLCICSGMQTFNPDGSGICCFIPEGEKSPTLPPNAAKVVVPKNHDLFPFVSSLHHRSFVVEGSPSEGIAVEFEPGDGWSSWFRAVHYPSTSKMTMSSLVWPLTQDTTMNFAFIFSPIPGHELTMSTAAATSAFGKEIDSHALQKMLIDRVTMVFALIPDTPAFTTNLKDLAVLLGYNVERSPALSFLASILTLKFDPSLTARNAMWFRPNLEHETSLRLQFKIETGDFNSWFGKTIKGIGISDIYVIARKTAHCHFNAEQDWAVAQGQLTFVMGLNIGKATFDASVEIQSDSITFTLSTPSASSKPGDGPPDVVRDILRWLNTQPSLEGIPLEDLLNSADEVIDRKKIAPRQVEMTIGLKEDGSLGSIETVSILIEASIAIGKPKKDMKAAASPLAFLFALGWARSKGVYLKGSLWCAPPVLESDIYQKALPDYEPHLVLEPVTLPRGTRLQNLDLRTLMSDGAVKNLPKCIPTEVAHAIMEISETGISFSGIIRCTETKDVKNRPPGLFLDTVSLSAGYTWAKDVPGRGFRLSLGVDLLLFPNAMFNEDKDIAEQDPARLTGRIKYESEAWALTAGIEELRVEHIASFWDADARSSVMQFLGNFEIENLSLEYHYDKSEGGDGKQFHIGGALKIGKILLLNLDYEHTGAEWLFSATVSDANPQDPITIGNVLEAILGETPTEVPRPILDANLSPNGNKEFFALKCSEKDKKIVFTVSINLGSVSLCFTQYRDKTWDKTKPSKRFVKAAISEVSVTVPMLGTLKQPFEQMYYLWVQDNEPMPTGKTEARGITKAEFEMLPTDTDTEKLFYKASKKKIADTDVVIGAGSHFFVVAKDTSGNDSAILDYHFGKPKASKLSRRLARQKATMAPGDVDGPEAEKGSKAPLKKALGPLSIDNVGLWYKNGKFGITLDATFLMGPIGLALLGFSIDVPFDKDHNLSKPPKLGDIGFSLEGLIVSFDKPPLTIAGGFMHTKMDNMDVYAGGLILKFDPWMFQAMGVYASVPREGSTDPKDKYTMLFIFCKLNGPLFSVGFADFSGLTAGVGINSDIALPTVEQVVEFPFVKPDGTGKPEDSPIATLKGLMKGIWFRPAEGSFWIAAGVKVTAFQMLAVDAVLVVQFSPNVKLGICAVATADMPSPRSGFRVAHIELGIVCTLDIDSGVFKLEAQLSPKSFVLHPSCHLTGGLALYSWFKDTPNGGVAGDWVLTIGGYHQAFSVPPQYPRPPRLAINWSLGSNISITGEAYFAVTPKVCMAGGRLHASLTAGGLYAYFDAFLDFLVNFEPFHFKGQASLAVGVRYTMDLWICTIRISAEIGATLTVAGPPFGGNVHVDFWVFGFDIGFGSSAPPPTPLDIHEFWNLVLKTSTSSPSRSLLSVPDDRARRTATKEPAFLITCQSGLEPGDDDDTKDKKDNPSKPSQPWYVHAGKFSFLVTLRFPTNVAKLNKTHHTFKDKEQPIPIPSDSVDIFARPMRLRSRLTSDTTINISQTEPPPKPLRAFRAPGNEVHIYESWATKKWQVETVVRSVERSIWDVYSPSLDPLVAGNHVGGLLNGDDSPTMQLVTGVAVTPPTSEMAPDEEIKFNVVEDMKLAVLEGNTPKFPEDRGVAEGAWGPREGQEGWNDVRELWEKGEKETGDLLGKAVELWGDRLGYKRGALKRKRPGRLLEDKTFKQRVPALPMVAVGYK